MTTAGPTKNVLLVTASVGAGHNQVARTLQDRLQAAAPNVHIEALDILDFYGRGFRAYYAGGFALGMTRFPRLFGMCFAMSNHPHRPGRAVYERPRLATERFLGRRYTQHVLARQYDLIINTHFLAPPQLAVQIDRGRLNVPQVMVVTDVEAHRWWYCDHIQQYYVPNDYTAGQLRTWGIGDDQITISGMPIHPKWTEPLDRDRIYKDWNLPRNLKIVTLAGGTSFTVGPIVKIARKLLAACGDLALVVLAGRNKKLLGDLVSLPQAGTRLFPVPFTDRAQELGEISELMITKPGGITTAECVAKGTPMVFLRPVPGHEAGNARYFQREGAGVITRNVKHLVQTVADLLKDNARRKEMQINAKRLYRPGADVVVEDLVRRFGL